MVDVWSLKCLYRDMAVFNVLIRLLKAYSVSTFLYYCLSSSDDKVVHAYVHIHVWVNDYSIKIRGSKQKVLFSFLFH